MTVRSENRKSNSLVDLFLPQFTNDPYALYQSLREQHSVYWDYAMQSWVVLGYEDIVKLSKDLRLSQDRVTPFYDRLPKDKQADLASLAHALSNMMLFNDPPTHTRLRTVLRRAFTPTMIMARQGFIEETVDAIFGKIAGQGRMDSIADLAQPVTKHVISDMVGIRPEASHLLDNWKSLLDDFFMQSNTEIKRIEQIKQEFEKSLESRRLEPGTDLVSEMIKAQSEGFEISNDEIFASMLLLIDAGQVTTTHFIANAIYALTQAPEQLQLLRENPDRIRVALNELMRYDSSVQFVTRIASEDIQYNEHLMKKGQSIILVFGSGNRDPQRFQAPDQLNVERADPHHLSFGHGIHYCLGAPLALLESEVVLRKLLERTESFWVEEEELEWHETINFRFLKRLHLGFRLK